MIEHAQPAVRWQRGTPEAIRALDTFARTDYSDTVTAQVGEGSGRSPEQWVVVLLAGMPPWLRRVLPLVQRSLLGLRLELRPSPEHLLGWRIAERAENWLRLEASSWLLTGHLVFHIDRGLLSFASFVRYDRRIAALIWPPASLIHRQVMLIMMRGAMRHR